jgi:hypothetical protein
MPSITHACATARVDGPGTRARDRRRRLASGLRMSVDVETDRDLQARDGGRDAPREPQGSGAAQANPRRAAHLMPRRNRSVGTSVVVRFRTNRQLKPDRRADSFSPESPIVAHPLNEIDAPSWSPRFGRARGGRKAFRAPLHRYEDPPTISLGFHGDRLGWRAAECSDRLRDQLADQEPKIAEPGVVQGVPQWFELPSSAPRTPWVAWKDNSDCASHDCRIPAV